MNLNEARRFLSVNVSKTKYASREIRGLDFNIDIDYLMMLLEKQKGKCALTGWNLEFTRGGDYGYGTNPLGCTIDRIDNNRGYVRGNVQLTCWLPNRTKHSMSNKEFYKMCRDIVNHAS